MKLGAIKSITIEYDDGKKEIFYRRLNNLTLEVLTRMPRYFNAYDHGVYLDSDDYKATFSWTVDNFKDKGK
jgi:hypothetical protein